jgi:S1-C subfamily serine protease
LSAGTGTGFIIDESGMIVTNAHVVGSARRVTVSLADGDELDGRVLGADPRYDLAVLQVDRDGLPTVELGDSDELQVGDAVIAIGNALGLSGGSGATVTTGIVSGLDRIVPVADEVLVNAIQTDAAINPGNSGGPLLDAGGRVVGINTAIASPDSSNNVGFAIAISSAKPIIEDLRAGRVPEIAFLGVMSETVTPSMAEDLGLPSDSGAVITEVTSGSAAEDAGLRVRDVITRIGDSEVTRMEEVARAVRRHRPGDDVTVEFVRGGERREVTVTLGDRPDDL